ncbi:Asp-tRNA(Asn)/Glu-tRNA(Gln) amidotransferase subunit GatB [Rickettsiales endosymbiont of Stachyamoeba lipophora]|uniref:Asp-tRNA(Asn)/Glu-tRNA(Gln) amidotransferase subunit GatB n=1 Tax=Rickettsiales endosymbiont of Stachyamoeba lipophora TaxID=2486578 RepID=UPI000F64957B|nr:Asp-tRNA(Asn)/Glu-tRNA(Gln) amidotransferase subunit GatB [Rickettsiales endosymbiont of Stachyamoeba lipophora]AZL15027.1 Asp-tRNA(Asn)/Glu-tRNA(Gln) amidotransferase GatCAB subunit B [Rickettsiales endosymbiont of Stachyamoeba lipophora]
MTIDLNKWEIVIGLEVHAQVASNSKLFSGASTEFGAEPNHNVSLIDAAFPGMLPRLNKFCVEQAVKTGIGIDAEINLVSFFDRKNYFYPDLPQGYQITQFYKPIVENGSLLIQLSDGTTKTIGIERIHLEQDAGKSLHDQSPNYTYIDLNRSGIALMEIVSRPDLRSAEEAAEYMKNLRLILRYLGTCDGDMEKGSLRCDANVSVRLRGEHKLGTRCEIKNLNSIRYITKAIEYEAERQIEIIENGGKIDQETRLYDVSTGETRTMRSKEDAFDYRYFPDPDLLPLIITQQFVDNIKASMPELPAQKCKRYTKTIGLSEYDAEVLTSEKEIAEYFEEVASQVDAKLAANWIMGDLFARLKKENLEIIESPISTDMLAKLIKLIESNVISGKIAKQVFEIMFDEKRDPEEIVEKEGLTQVTDISSIEKIIEEVLNNNQDKVAEYKSGKDKLFGFFVGQVMKLSGGKVNPEILNGILKKKLSS